MSDAPSNALLTTFRAILRRLELNDLLVLRERFEALREHPLTCDAIEQELAKRRAGSANPG